MLLCQVREDGPLWDRWSSFCCDACGASSYKAKWIVVPDGQGGARRVSKLRSSPRLAHARPSPLTPAVWAPQVSPYYEEMVRTIPAECYVVVDKSCTIEPNSMEREQH